jgi:hypothetical protein
MLGSEIAQHEPVGQEVQGRRLVAAISPSLSITVEIRREDTPPLKDRDANSTSGGWNAPSLCEGFTAPPKLLVQAQVIE